MDDTDRGAPPRDGLVRAMPGIEVRDADPGGDGRIGTLRGHFSVFDTWYEVDSAWEGHFIECVAPGAFAATIRDDRPRMRVTFNHGQDPSLGDKVLGPIETLEEDDLGARYEVPLLDTTYNRDLLPGLRAGVYGSSFRFNVEEEEFVRKPPSSDHNPGALPERTITRARVSEFGPVTFPANPAATAGARSLTDRFRPAPPPVEPARPAQPKEGTVSQTTQRAPVSRTDRPARIKDLREDAERFNDAHAGTLSPELQAEWDNLTEEIRALEADEAADQHRLAFISAQVSQRAEQDVPTASTIPVGYSGPNVRKARVVDIWDRTEIGRVARNAEDERGLVRDSALRATDALRVQGDRYDNDLSKARLDDLLRNLDSEDGEIAERVIAVGSPRYRDAFVRYVASGGEERGTALAVGVDGTGGYAVPVAFDPTIVAIGAWTAINPYRASCRVVTIAGTDTWEALTSTAVTAAYAAEAAAATEQGPTFARPSYVAKRAHAFVTASYEMAQDRPNLPGELGVLFGEAKDTLEENQFTVGVGTTVYPQGIGLKDAFTRVDSVTNDTVAVADVRAVEAGIPIRHRLNAAWYLSRAAIRAIQAFETTGGQLFNGAGYPAVGNPANARTGNTGLTLLGYPIWETPSMPWTPTTDDTTWGVLMDPRNYVIVDRVGMSVRVIPDMLNGATPSFPTGEIGIYAFWRNTARVLNVDGGRQGAVQ